MTESNPGVNVSTNPNPGVTIAQHLMVEGNTKLKGSVKVDSNIKVEGDAFVVNSLLSSAELVSRGNATVHGMLDVDQDLTTEGTVLAGNGFWLMSHEEEGEDSEGNPPVETQVLSDKMNRIPPASEDGHWDDLDDEDHFGRTNYLAWRLDEFIKELQRVSLMRHE